MFGLKRVTSVFLGGAWLTMMGTHLMAFTVTPIPAPMFIPMDTPTVNLAGPPKVLVEKTLTLQAGEKRRVFGTAQIASSVNSDVFVAVYVECVGPNGFKSELGDTNQNHAGNDTPIGPSYPWPGQLALHPSLLLQAPIAGSYTCSLSASANNSALTVIARDYDNFSITWLQVSATNDAGAGWWQNQPCAATGDTVPIAANGHSTCYYIGPNAGESSQLDVFEAGGYPVPVWEAASNAAFVEASDSLLLTTCYYGTKSCTPENSESWWTHEFSDPGGTMVQTHLELVQLNSLGGPCKTTLSPNQISKVDSDAHHFMIYNSLLDVPVYPSCGLPYRFTVRLWVQYLSGNPAKIDGSSPYPGSSTFTHAWAINSVYGTAPPIPDLVGLTEAQAREAILEAGYAVAQVTYGLSAAQAGTVISQYPAAGLIQLPGLGVNLSVSAGGATVPSVVSLPESSAISRIDAAGLVPKVFLSKACVNLGDVLTQSPAPGTVVWPGSTVSITVDSGTRQTCIIK